MTTRTLTDAQIRAAFIARSEGSPSPELADRIGAATRRARQLPKLVVLPGGLGVAPQRILWAAAISATSLALVGGLLLAGRQPDNQTAVPPNVGPTPTATVAPEPSEAPSPPSSAEPTAEPTPPVEPTPDPVDPGLAVDSPAVTLVGDLRIRSKPTVDDSSARLEPLLPGGVRLLVIEEPVVADGYTWYHVLAFEPGYPRGWVAAGSREGESWIAADQTPCPTLPLDVAELVELGAYGGLACFGSQDVEVSAETTCSMADVDYSIGGATWMSSDYACFFEEDGSPAFGFHPDGVQVDLEAQHVPYLVTGHFADSQSSSCEWVVDPPAPDPAEIAATCRAMFVVTAMDPVR